jgi:hypothetical protein
MLIEVRQLRNDLQVAAATIQRVQIVMYRLYAQATVFDRATQRLDQARDRCTSAYAQRVMMTNRIEQIEAGARSAQDPSAQEVLAQLRATVETFATEEQQCQAEKAEAEIHFRTEQAKMTDLQDQLDKLDRILAGLGSK